MGRSKPTPKRRRVEDEEAQQQAIQTLLAAPADQVEAAAAEATRSSMQHWPKLSNDVIVPEWIEGLGLATTVPTHHLEALRRLHERIKEQAKKSSWASWSGSPDDPRRRAFGVLPDTLGSRDDVRDCLDISTPWTSRTLTTGRNTNKPVDDERTRNHKAIVLLDKLPEGCREAIDWLCQTLNDSIIAPKQIVHDPDSNNKNNLPLPLPLQGYLHYDFLVAAQPNLHCGRDLLPIHVDHPLKDGFGIIIVTISMVGSGTILLQNHTGTQKRTMTVGQGQAYMLSGMARNACAHGVVATQSEGGVRESLNLRFGLHDYDCSITRGGARRGKQDEKDTPFCRLPVIPSRDVLQFWELPNSNDNTANASTATTVTVVNKETLVDSKGIGYGELGYTPSVPNTDTPAAGTKGENDDSWELQISNNNTAEYPEGMVCRGLGYSPSVPNTDADATGTNGENHDSSLLVKDLMRQCLEYHEQQQPERQVGYQSNNRRNVPETIQFPSQADNPQPEIGKIHLSVEEGRARANAILAKFQQLTRDHGVVEADQPPIAGPNAAVGIEGVPLITAPVAAEVFREKREKFFVQEAKRKNIFFVKNLEYVARREARRLQNHMVQLDEARQWEDQVQDQYRQVLVERKKRLLGGGNGDKGMVTQAGIGTAKRKRVEKEKKRAGNVPASRHLQESLSLSFYLTGIPLDGSLSEHFIHQLFCSYGKIRKVHFYRNKVSGQLKGDALVVYDIKPKERDAILRNVCSQVCSIWCFF